MKLYLAYQNAQPKPKGMNALYLFPLFSLAFRCSLGYVLWTFCPPMVIADRLFIERDGALEINQHLATESLNILRIEPGTEIA